MVQSALLIVNPIAGRGKGERTLPELENGLREAGIDTQVAVTAQAGDAREAAGALAGAHDAVICVGGDGTLNEVINGVPPDCPVAQFPIGTGNVLAKELGLPRRIAPFCQMVRAGRQKAIDLGAANGQKFASFAGIGFGAAVTEAMATARSGAIHMWRYAGLILRGFAAGRFPRIEVSVDGGVPVVAAGFALISSVRSYGGPICIAPQARHDDGMFDLCILPKGSRFQYLRALTAFLLGCARGCSGAQYFRGRTFHAASAQRAPYQLDGDATGVLPVTVEVLDERLPVIVP